MFTVMLFLLTVGTVAFHQLVKVYQMTVEVRTVYAGKLDLAANIATADRATVEERLAAGESAEEAEAEFLTDEYFEAWYQSLCDALSQYEG